MIDGSTSRFSASPPATPARIRSSRDRYSRSVTATSRVEGERAQVRPGFEVNLDRGRVVARARPRRAVADEPVTVVVVGGEVAPAGAQAQTRALRRAQLHGAGVRLDRSGHRLVREHDAERTGIHDRLEPL